MDMVDVMGHVAMGLLFATPAWFVWTERVSVVFVVITAVAALFPDVDLWVSRLLPRLVHHHGVFHTVVFVGIASVVVGALVAATLVRPIDRWVGYDRFDARSLFTFAGGAVFLGGISHLFADSLSAPDIASPIEPFWPFFDKPWSLELIWYNSPRWNVGLLTVAIVAHLGLAYLVDPVDHRFRMR